MQTTTGPYLFGMMAGGNNGQNMFGTIVGNGSKLPFTDMAHMELNIDFNLEKSRALIWVYGCEIYAESEHYSAQFRAGRSSAPTSLFASRSTALDCRYLQFAFSVYGMKETALCHYLTLKMKLKM